MKKIKHTIITGAGILMLSLSQLSSAAITTVGCADASQCSLEELTDGATISINDIIFNNWSEIDNLFVGFDNNGDEIDSVLSLSNIWVTGIDAITTGNPNEFTLGLNFSSSNGMSIIDVEEGEVELSIDYSATASNGTTVTDAELTLGDNNLDSGDAFVQAQLNSSLPAFALETYREFIDPDEDLVDMDQANFTAVSALDLNTNVQLGTFEPGSVELFSFDVLFTIFTQSTQPPISNPVPAPASLSIILLALAGLYLRSRKYNH